MSFLLILNLLCFLDIKATLNNFPNCRHCKFFKPNLSGYEFSKCTRFGEKIKDSNVIIYEYADLVRLDEQKCGPQGKLYQIKDYRDLLDIITDQHLHK